MLISGAVIIAVISFITLRKARIGGPIEQYDVVLQGLRAHALRRV